MPGPPRKPTSLKLLEGTFRKDRAPKHEPRPGRGRPRCPAWLDGEGRACWRQLVPLLEGMRVLTIADGMALALGCAALAEYLAARAAIAKHGATYASVTPAGGSIVRPRPEVQMAADAWRRVKAMLSEFGLTPAARGRVEAAPPGAPGANDGDPLAQFLFGRRA